MNPQRLTSAGYQLFPLQPTRRLPDLTDEMRLGLAAVELAAGRPFHEVRFNRPGGEEAYQASTRILRRLISEGLIEVVSMAPAVYRVTKLGKLVRELRR